MKTKRIAALLVALLTGGAAISAFSGCDDPNGGNNQYDATKANLTVATFDGGVGRAWLDAAAERFEELYKDATHFQEGRTGVNIIVDADKTKYGGLYLEDKALNKDVYFTEGVDYYAYVNAGKVADITDVVTQPISGANSKLTESGTIEDKLDPSLASFLTAKDDKYYMLPFYDGFYGFIYDVDLFEEAGFYFDEDGDFLRLVNEAQRKTFEENKSKGPDGVKGTYDDGLPATYEQMIKLCDEIVAKSYVPFCYSGSYNDYVSKACRAFIADYEGYEGFKLNYTFNGTANLVKEIKADGTLEMEEVVITEDNAYELQRQAGKYYALKMQEELFGSVKYIGNSWNGFDYTVAQSEFIKSKYSSKRYAMLLEGVWWENEADNIFSELETIRGEKKSDRRFGFLPMPKVNEEAAGPQTMFSSNSSFGFINKTCQNMELAKEFMRFLHTDAEMSKFSAKTSISRSLNYTVSAEDKATATHFGKSLIEMRGQAQVVYPYSSLELVINNSAAFTEGAWFLTATVDGKTLNNPFTAFKDDTATAEQYFKGLYAYQQKMWSNLQK